MTTLNLDQSIEPAENLRAFVNEYLEHPDRAPAIGVPKAPNAALKVTVRAQTLAAAYARAGAMATWVANAINTEGRVRVRNIITSAAETDVDADETVELLPWIG